MAKLLKTDSYWSDRYQKVINCYVCLDCGKHLNNLNRQHIKHKCKTEKSARKNSTYEKKYPNVNRTN